MYGVRKVDGNYVTGSLVILAARTRPKGVDEYHEIDNISQRTYIV